MAVFRISPHMDDDVVSVDVQYADNPFSTWTALITDDPIANYPKKFSNTSVTENTYLKFRLKASDGSYTDWSLPVKPLSNSRPEPNKNLCFVYGRLRSINTQEPLNSPRISFQYVSGTPTLSAPLVRDITVEADNYGWFIVPISPGCIYTAICNDVPVKKNITVPSIHNAKFSTL
ncbi:MAG: hypothetical protein AABY07_10995 [Nanoarchaeota archaeon]